MCICLCILIYIYRHIYVYRQGHRTCIYRSTDLDVQQAAPALVPWRSPPVSSLRLPLGRRSSWHIDMI